MKDSPYAATPTGIVVIVASVYVVLILLGALSLFYAMTTPGDGC